jgi:hypothetical protein
MDKMALRKRLKSIVAFYYKSSERVRNDVLLVVEENIRGGLPVEPSCLLAGITPGTYYLWELAGKEALELGPGTTYYGNRHVRRNDEHVEFYLRIERAKAQYQQSVVSRSINTDRYNPNWVRDMGILERRYRRDWGRFDKLQIQSQQTGQQSTDERYL